MTNTTTSTPCFTQVRASGNPQSEDSLFSLLGRSSSPTITTSRQSFPRMMASSSAINSTSSFGRDNIVGILDEALALLDDPSPAMANALDSRSLIGSINDVFHLEEDGPRQ